MDESKVRHQIESNDPDLVEFDVGLDYYIPPDGDWGRLGTDIGRNTHLRMLGFFCFDGADVEEEFEKKFFRGVACSRSIQKLSLQYHSFGGEKFRILLPLFKRNIVETLSIWNQLDDDDDICLLATDLAEFDSLREFELSFCELDDNRLEEVIQALAGHSELSKLDLTQTPLGRNACAALASLLHNANSKLSFLDLTCSWIDDEGAEALAPGLAGNGTLKDLDLSENFSITEMGDPGITEMGWRAIFTALQSPSCRLEKLSLARNDGINAAAAVFLSGALTNNTTTLKSLNLNCCGTRLDTFGFLQSPNCTLEELDLSSNRFDNNVIISLANALTNNKSLGSLNLSCNPQIATAGWQAFSAVLESTNSELEKLDLSWSTINDEAVNSIANALVNNTKLRELNLSGDREQVTITDNGWGTFSRVLCNTPSIMDTHHSNHTLEQVTVNGDRLPQDLKSLLQLNRNNTKSQAARLKIIKTHFSEGFAVHTFVDMDRKALPRAIAWMGKDGRSNETPHHLYEFIRSVPLMFQVMEN